MNGWFKIHRQIFESEVFSDPVLLQLFIWCVGKANIQPRFFEGVRIPVGSFATGRLSGADEVGCSPSAFYRRMKKLESMGNIEQRTNNKFTVISVVKYSEFQHEGKIANNERTTSEQPANIQRTQLEKDKKDKKERRKRAFDVFWDLVPKKVSKEPARQAFMKSEADPEYLIERMRIWANSEHASDPYKGRLHISTWINQKRYEDDESVWNEKPPTNGKPEKPQAPNIPNLRDLTR
jgi:hypothetical protein